MSGDGNTLLVVTDGTAENTATLIATIAGGILEDWLPKTPQPMSPIWASSPYLDGKRLVTKTYDNILDTFTIAISTSDQDNTILKIRKFFELLEQAIKYWTNDFETHKFWLEARSTCETETRYAIAVDYNIPEANNPYEPPFASSEPSTVDEIQLTIEHTIWTNSLEIGDNCVKVNTLSEQTKIHQNNFGTLVSTDVCYVMDGPNLINTGAIAIGNAAGTTESMGIRFRNIMIPRGATIARAWLIMNASATHAGDTCSGNINIEGSYTPAAFSTYADYWARGRSGGSVAWTPIPHMTENSWYGTSDISLMLYAHILDAQWVEGGDIVFFIENNASSLNAYRTGHGPADASPALYVEWYVDDDSDTITMGEPDTCDRAPAVVPFQKMRALTHAFVYDASAATFWGNLVDDTLAVNEPLLPGAALQNTDCCYFGISDLGTASRAEPFNNLVLHLAVAQTNITTAVMEYWNGAWASLAALTVAAEPTYFWDAAATPGMHFIQWNMPSDWAQCTVNNISGYWVRFRPVGIGANPTPPYQAPYHAIYTIMQSHVEIAADELKGDINALVDFLVGQAGSTRANTLMVCAKKYAHTNGGKFYPYLPCKHLITGLPDAHVSAVAGVSTITSETYTGYCIRWNTAGGAPAENIFAVDLGAKTYAGTYRVFLRVNHEAGISLGCFNFRLAILTYLSGGAYYTQWVSNKVSVGPTEEVIDLGFLELPYQALLEQNINAASDATIYVQGQCNSAGLHTKCLDLVLMPVDDATIEVTTSNHDSGLEYENKIITSDYKVGPYANRGYKPLVANKMIPDWDAELWYGLRAAILGAFELEPNEKYWIYFFLYGGYLISTNEIFSYLLLPSMDKKQRYLLLRGSE